MPTGFEAYARVLHEVQGYGEESPVVRWSDVARWSAVPLGPSTEWIDVAIPEVAPSQAPPWSNQGPREGWLSTSDTLALADVLDPSSRAPCYFGVWSGHGPLISVRERVGADASMPTRYEPLASFELPWREYQLYTGESAGAASFISTGRRYQSPNIWWAADRSWFVATEIDLPVTFVGGSQETINRLLVDLRLEVTRTGPNVSILRRFRPWLVAVIDTAYEEVLTTGAAEIELSMGTVSLTFEKSGRHKARLATRSQSILGSWSSSGSGLVSTRDPEFFRVSARFSIESAIASLVS